MNPVRGGGSASELTMTSWSALATTTRSCRPSTCVVVVGGAAQHRGALVDPDDPGQRAGVAGHVADDPHPVADDDAVRPSSRARIAVTLRSSSSTTQV